MTSNDEYDLAILGAGLVGLTIAWEISSCGPRVAVVERSHAPVSASWAAAGMLPPMDPARARNPLDQLHGLSHQLYPDWVARLQTESDTEVEFWRCGGLHLARTAGEAAALRAAAESWSEDGIRIEPVGHGQIANYEPELNDRFGNADHHLAYYLPEEGQVRTPRLMQALRRACQARSVSMAFWPDPIQIQPGSQGNWTIRSQDKIVVSKAICFAVGAWTAPLLATFGVRLELEPRRGQMILLAASDVRLRGLINEGPRYLVPRRDGRILVGSTVEDVGFDQSTVPADLQALKAFACGLVPRLETVSIEASWAGLRPRTGDGYPFLGKLPGLDHAFIAAGHFRDGIQLAPITGCVMRDLILQRTPRVDLTPFRPDRE